MNLKRDKKNGGRVKRVGAGMVQTLSVASQMALLFPTGMEVWMRRELGDYIEPPRHGMGPQ
ncbi:MAG TPA: hypothetical protein VHP56_00420 [Solirubrobacterales bacterium]|jgi:hypothetical protein|nr:hypothetical protein [Solirubrobacterales bacterium]